MAEPIFTGDSHNSELPRRQRLAAIRALETIAARVQELHTRFSEKEATLYRRQLFQLPSIKGLLEEKGISEEDEPDEIERKLQELVESLKEENERQVFYPEETPKPEIVPVVPEAVREQVMAIQDEINKLIQKRDENSNYAEQERPKVEEALGRLAVFGSDIPPKEKVEVVRTPDGSVEVIFESDVDEVEALRLISTDIQECQRRIAEYERNIEEKKRQEQKGFFKKVFSSKKQTGQTGEPNPLQAFSVKELEGKKGRSEQALLEIVQDYEARNKELQKRIQEKKQALEVPLTVTGTDTFAGSWKDLSVKLQEGGKKFLEELDQNIAQLDEEIQTLETKRDALEKEAD